MPRFIFIETSTALSSAAIAENGTIICTRESDTPRAQASLTAPFIKEMLDECGLVVPDFDAVCVSAGPGSYTGLRVGVSTAKGLCFGAGIPLIGICTLDVLVHQAIDSGLVPEGCRAIVPMVDARRMEVYQAVYSFDASGKPVRSSEVEPRVIDPESYSSLLQEGPVLFIGDGAAKCSEIIKSPAAFFVQICPHASALLRPAIARFEASEFDNTAYFEPYYLKDFVATVSRKKLF